MTRLRKLAITFAACLGVLTGSTALAATLANSTLSMSAGDTVSVSCPNALSVSNQAADSLTLNCAGYPLAPAAPTVVAGNGQVTVSWTAPASSSPITAYQVRAMNGTTVVGTEKTTASPYTYAGLTNGTAYGFEVQAENATGWGPFSAESAVVTPSAPVSPPPSSAPSFVQADDTGTINGTTTGIGSGQSNQILAHDTGIGHSVIVVVQALTAPGTQTDAVTSVTSPMGTFQRVNSYNDGADNEIWICLNTTGAADTITVNTPTNAWNAFAVEYNEPATGFVDQGGSDTDPGYLANQSFTDSPGAAGNVAFVAVDTADAYNTGPAAPWTYYNSGYWSFLNGTSAAWQVAQSSSPVTASWQTDGGDSSSQGVVLQYGGTLTPPPPAPLSLTTSSLAAATVGSSYSATLGASGGVAPYTFSATGLPAGLSLSGDTISGTPRAAGTSTVSVTVTDSSSPARTATANLSLVVNAASSGGGGGTGGTCTNPVYSSSSASATYNNDSTGTWWVNNDAWNGGAGPQTINVCSPSSWYAVSNQPNDGGAVETYPDTEYDIGGRNSMSTETIGQYVSNGGSITSTFSEADPVDSTSGWDAAYDLWLNNWGTEIMIWNQWNGGQSYWPDQATISLTLDGVGYKFYDNGGELMFFRDTQVQSGSVDILAAFNWLVQNGYVSSTDVPTQLEYGVEICYTSGNETFPMNGLTFNVTP